MKRAILLIDHGSRRVEAHEQLLHLAERMRARLLTTHEHPGALVEIAHLELAHPTINDGVNACARAGASEIRAIPCFLSRGKHVTEHLPGLLAKTVSQFPGLTFTLAAPLVEQAGFIDLLISAASAK